MMHKKAAAYKTSHAMNKLIHHRRVILIRMEKKNTYDLIPAIFNNFSSGWKKKERNVPNGSAISFSSHDYQRVFFFHTSQSLASD